MTARPVDAGDRLGEAFARALAVKDRDALVALLDPHVEFRAMTPHRSWQAEDPAGVVDDVMLGCWFEPSDVIEALESVDSGTVGDRHRVTYRLRIDSGQRCVCEQTAYYDVSDGRIGWLRILCSGFRPYPMTTRECEVNAS